MLVGAGTSTIDWDTLETKVGAPLQARRSYDGGRPTKVNSIVLGDYQAGRRSVYSMKTNNPTNAANGGERAALESALRQIPSDHRVDYMEWHEPEDDRVSHDLFYAVQQNAWEVVRLVNRDRVTPIRFGGCLMAYTARKGGAEAWAHPGWRFISYDGYDWDGVGKTAESIFSPGADLCDRLGMRFGIAETGSDMVNRDTNQPNLDRAAWITQSRAWAASRDAKWWLYWSNDDNNLTRPDEFEALRP